MWEVSDPEGYPFGVKPEDGRKYFEIVACCPWCEETGEIQEAHFACHIPEIPEGFREETIPILTGSGWTMLISCPA